MNTRVGGTAGRASRWTWLPVVFVPLVAWSKDAAVPALVLVAVLTVAQRGRAPTERMLYPLSPAVMIFGAAFVFWTVISMTWAPAPDWSNWLKAFGAMIAAVIAVCGLARVSEAVLEKTVPPLTIATIVLFVLLLVERITGGALIGSVRVHDPAARLFDLMSPGLMLLCALAYPVAFLLWRRAGKWILSAGFVLAIFAMALTYRMDAAPFALAAGAVSWLLVRLLGRAGFIFVVAGLCVVTLSWGPAATLAWSHGLVDWFDNIATTNWGYRIEIWHRVSQLIAERIWLGYGFDAARYLGKPGVSPIVFLHPHNGLLQVWLELGAVGAALFLGWALSCAAALLQSSARTPVLAIVAATVTALAVFWSISFGIWQGWWISAIGLTLCALAVVIRLGSDHSSRSMSADSASSIR